MVPIADWPQSMLANANQVAANALRGVGAEWEMVEMGDKALHVRRRCNASEMRVLYSVNPAAPVFTHGCALREMEA